MAIKYGFSGVNSNLNSGRDNQSSIQLQLDTLSANIISARVTDIILDDQHPKFNTYGQWSSIGNIFFERVEGAPNISFNSSLMGFVFLIYSLKSPPLQIGYTNTSYILLLVVCRK